MSQSSKPSFDSEPYNGNEIYLITWFDEQLDLKDLLITTAKRIYSHRYCEDRNTAFEAAVRILLAKEL